MTLYQKYVYALLPQDRVTVVKSRRSGKWVVAGGRAKWGVFESWTEAVSNAV